MTKVVEINDVPAQPKSVLQSYGVPAGKTAHGLGISIHYVIGHLAAILDHNRSAEDLYVPYVNFSDSRNLFYDANVGPNLWNYYFDKLEPDSLDLPRVEVQPINFSGMRAWSSTELELGREAFQTFVRLKPELVSAVDAYWKLLGTENVLAVHIRGTDKRKEIPPLLPSDWMKIIMDKLGSEMPSDRVFLATDDPAYEAELRRTFGSMLVTCLTTRTGAALHYNQPFTPYRTGFEALIEAFVAARCRYLIRSLSNFSSLMMLAGNHEKIKTVACF